MKPPALRSPGWVAEFRSFILRGNVVDLAVGIIIGAAFTAIVQSLVKDIITPVIGLLLGGVDFSNIFVTLRGEHYATLAEAQKAGSPTMNVGVFVNAVIQFVIVAFVIFWIVKLISKLYVRQEAKPAAPPQSEILLTEIRDLLAGRTPPTPPSLSI